MVTRVALPVRYTRDSYNLLWDASTTTGVTATGGGAIAADSTVPSPVASASIRATAPGSSTTWQYEKTITSQSAANWVGVGAYLRTARSPGALGVSNCNVLFYFATTGFAWRVFSFGSEANQEWQAIVINRDDLTLGGGATAASWTSENIIKILVQRAATANEVQFWFGGAFAIGRGRPKVILCLDGGYLSQYTTGKAILDAADILPSMMISPATLGTGTGVNEVMTEAQLDEFLADGYDLQGHEFSGTTGYADAGAFPTAASIQADIGSMKDWVAAKGGTMVAQAIPYTNPFDDATAEPLFRAAAGASTVPIFRLGTAITTYQKQTAVGDAICNRKNLNSEQLHNTLTAAQALATVDSAIKTGQTCVHYIHRIEGSDAANQWDSTKFQAYITGLVQRREAGLVDIVNFSQWWDGYQRGTRIVG